MFSKQWGLAAACLIGVAAAATAQVAQPTVIATAVVDERGPDTVPVIVPVDIHMNFGKFKAVKLRVSDGGQNFDVVGQLVEPGLVARGAMPADYVKLRRHLVFMPPAKAGKKLVVEVTAAEVAADPATGFEWKAKPGEYVDLLYKGTPVARYMHAAYDASTPEKRDKTYKVFHHLYDSTGKRFVTNGGQTNEPQPKNPKDLLFPHHRGLMYAFNKITYDGNKTCDTWHAKPGDTHQSHDKVLGTDAGPVLARHLLAITWHGPKGEVFANEEREITIYAGDKGRLVDFASRLAPVKGKLKLDGDPQHAGFQFRAHNDINEQKTNKETYYLRPDGKGKPGETRNWDPKTSKGPVNLPWDACSFVIDGKRYTAAYFNHPSNPKESRWSERDYGRFGCYFEAEATPENPLVVNYRVWLQDGEATVEEIDALYRAFASPPKVSVK